MIENYAFQKAELKYLSNTSEKFFKNKSAKAVGQ